MKRSTPFALLALTGAMLSACAPQPTPDGTKPTISLTATPTTITTAGQVTLNATAADNVGVTKVDFYQGTTLIGSDTTAPYSVTSANITSAQNGTLTYRAVASDAADNTAEATTTVTVNIDVTAPTVSVTATPNTLTSPGTATFTATAADNVGVTKVEFYDNGTLISTDTTAPYTASKTYAAADNGTRTITAKAFDAQGQSTSATATLTVDIDLPPTLTVTVSPEVITVAQPVTVTANAMDDRGISKVEFYVDGQLVATDTTAAYSTTLNFTYLQNGQRTITVKAYDSKGQMTEASKVVTVALDAGENNNSVAQATLITIGQSVSARIAGIPRDYDYYTFSGAAGDRLKLTVRSQSVDPASTLDPYVMILMPDGKTVLEKDDDSGLGFESELRFDLPQAGMYYVVVTSFNIYDDANATDDKLSNTYRLDLTRR